MKRDVSDLKNLSLRLPREMWAFLKVTAVEQQVSMTDIVIHCVDKYRKKLGIKNRPDDSNT